MQVAPRGLDAPRRHRVARASWHGSHPVAEECPQLRQDPARHPPRPNGVVVNAMGVAGLAGKTKAHTVDAERTWPVVSEIASAGQVVADPLHPCRVKIGACDSQLPLRVLRGPALIQRPLGDTIVTSPLCTRKCEHTSDGPTSSRRRGPRSVAVAKPWCGVGWSHGGVVRIGKDGCGG